MRHEEGGVRLLETLSGSGTQHYLRLQLCSQQHTEAMPGQFCLLGTQGLHVPCSYVSLPGVAGRFIVTTHGAQLGREGDLLDYSGPLGSAWPLPLHSTRLLAISRAEGILALLCTLDEIHCWLPWVQIQLSHEGFPIDHLPAECLHGFSARFPLPRNNSCSGWTLLASQLEGFRPDTVYCCAPEQVARQAARICWQKGVPAQRIWLRTDQVPRPAGCWQPALGSPVQRYDRLLSMLNWRLPIDRD